jgi:hypothetical protein
MNRHTKLALMVVPFLAIGGFIASDFWVEDQAGKSRTFQLIPDGHCDVINQQCVLKSGEFKINVSDVNGVTEINSTFPLDRATFFMVDRHNNATEYQLGMQDSPYYWQRETSLREKVSKKGEKYKLRLVAQIKGGQYISEFYTQTTK